MFASRVWLKSLSWSTAKMPSPSGPAEAARKGQPGREATTEAERGEGSVGVLNQDAIVAASTDIGEDRKVRKRLADAYCMRQTHRIGDQIARDQRARRKIEA